MVEHDVRVPAGDEPDTLRFVHGINLVGITTQYLRRLMVKFNLFQFPGDELFQGFGLGRWDAPPVGKVFEGRGAVRAVELSQQGSQGLFAGRLVLSTYPLVWPGEGYFCALAGTEDEASLMGCLLKEASKAREKMRLEDRAQVRPLYDLTGQLLPCQSVLVESVVDCLCYLFLLRLGDLVFLVFRPRSYPVRDFLALKVVPSLERGYVCRETIGGEQVECAPHCPSLDEVPVFPESILNVFDSDVFDPRP